MEFNKGDFIQLKGDPERYGFHTGETRDGRRGLNHYIIFKICPEGQEYEVNTPYLGQWVPEDQLTAAVGMPDDFFKPFFEMDRYKRVWQ